MLKGKKRIKIKSIKSEEQKQLENFLKILIIIVIFMFGAYIVTKIFMNNENNYKNDIVNGTINYEKLIVGNILNQNYSEYYVIVFSENDKDAIYYRTIFDLYNNKENAKKIFRIDLNDKMNYKYVLKENEKENDKPEKITDLKFGNFTLVKIKDKKIIKYINNIEEAKKELLK